MKMPATPTLASTASPFQVLLFVIVAQQSLAAAVVARVRFLLSWFLIT